MSIKPLVSIIINNYNYGAYIGQAIESAIAQTYPNKEIIVVDDGSTDNSIDIIPKYSSHINIILKDNGGQASAVNTGFKESNGELIILLDSDDYLEPHALENIVPIYSMHNNVARIHWPLWRVDSTGKKSGELLPNVQLAEGNLREQLIMLGPAHCGGPPISPPTSGNAWARTFLEKVLPIPEEDFAGGIDHYLFVLTPLFGEIKCLNTPLGFYRVHGTNLTLKPSYLTTFLKEYESCCDALSKYLYLEHGINKDPLAWPRDHWYHKVNAGMTCITSIVPGNSSFILIDDNAWMTSPNMAGRQRIYFLEENGVYNGVPGNDQVAILEIELQRVKGTRFVVIVWTSFWWLDHFKELAKYLFREFNCVLKNDLVTIFQLNSRN